MSTFNNSTSPYHGQTMLVWSLLFSITSNSCLHVHAGYSVVYFVFHSLRCNTGILAAWQLLSVTDTTRPTSQLKGTFLTFPLRPYVLFLTTMPKSHSGKSLNVTSHQHSAEYIQLSLRKLVLTGERWARSDNVEPSMTNWQYFLRCPLYREPTLLSMSH